MNLLWERQRLHHLINLSRLRLNVCNGSKADFLQLRLWWLADTPRQVQSDACTRYSDVEKVLERVMTMGRRSDGSAGDVDYGEIGRSYGRFRQPEPAIAAQIFAALGDARTVLNVGAGTGSYEPTDREVTAVEPSASMRSQRPAHLGPAIVAVAEDLPFADSSFDASMATVTVHQWSDLEKGLAEMRRVTRGPVVLLVCDPSLMKDYWLDDYIPELRAIEAARFPPIDRIATALGGQVEVKPVPVPLNCRDGFNEAYYGRPEAFLDPDARLACSSWSLVPKAAVDRFVEHLARDLASGRWDERYGHLRVQPFFEGPLRLVVGTRA